MKPQLEKWVERLRQGDQSAFLPLYEKTAPGLLKFLLWKTNGDRPTAEDILQESYVKFLLNLDRLHSIEGMVVHAYLLQIVKNCMIDKLTRTPQATRKHISTELLFDLADPESTSRQERAVEMRELSVAMKCLNEKETEIIWLRDGLGFSHKEVATQIGISEQASRQAYVRAKRTLLTQLKSAFLPAEDSNLGGTLVAEMSTT